MRLLVAAVVLLGGCAALEPGGGVVDTVVAEAVVAARAPAAEQAAALAKAEKEAKRAGAMTPAGRLRLATLLATLPAPLRDDARAAELLAPIVDASSPGIGRFAALLAAQLAERQRAARERERSDRERDKREEALRQSEEALRQQLEALRTVERGILEREEKLRRRQR